MKQTAVYARCAVAAEGGIERQLQRCVEAARRNGLVVEACLTFSDNGYGGLAPARERPAFKRMTQVLAEVNIGVLVIDELSRLSRSTSELGELLQWLEQVGVRLITADGLGVEAPMAQFYTAGSGNCLGTRRT